MREKMKRVKHVVENILMAVVIGALLLAGLYALFSENVLPTLSRRITEMFNYAG